MNDRLTACLAVLLVSGSAMPAASDSMEPMSVMIGGEAEFDACAAIGIVSGLDPDGSNSLRVRNGPGTDHVQIDSVTDGQILYLCASEADWYGVVYGSEEMDCEVSTPVAERIEYSGPCRWGWVHGGYVTALAG